MIGTEDAAGPIIVLFDELAKIGQDQLVPMIIQLVEVLISDIIPNMGMWLNMVSALIQLFIALIPVINLVVGLMLSIMAIVTPVITAIAGLVAAVVSLLTLDFGGVMDGLQLAAEGIGNLLLSPINVMAGLNVAVGREGNFVDVNNFPGITDSSHGTSRPMSGDGGSHRGGVFEHGGIIGAPTLALMGEAGPEAVIPLKGGSIPVEFTKAVRGDGAQQVLNITIESFTAIGTTTDELADLIIEELPKKIFEEMHEFFTI